MHKRLWLLSAVLGFLPPSFLLHGQESANWHYPLYLSNLNYWHSRIPVKIENSSIEDIAGEPAGITVGHGEGKLPLAGVDAAALRVVDSEGHELLWRLTSPGERLITGGPVPDAAEFLMPVTVKAGESETYYIYYDNPDTWSTGATLGCHPHVINRGFEMSSEKGPYGWGIEKTGMESTLQWCREYPHSGEFCIRTRIVSPGRNDGKGAGQKDIFVRAGARYRAEAWVKAKNVTGKAGWRVLVGDMATYDKDFVKEEHILDGGNGTYGWKKVSTEFTVPLNANSARIYTMLDGTGTAWFDDVQLKCLTRESFRVKILPVQSITLNKNGNTEDWPDDTKWDMRAPIKVMNFSENETKELPVYVKMDQVFQRLHNKVDQFTNLQPGNRAGRPFFRFSNAVVMDENVPARSEQTTYVYFAGGEKKDLMTCKKEYSRWISDRRNLVRNPDMVQGENNWESLSRASTPEYNDQGSPGKITVSGQGLKLQHTNSQKLREIGWAQNISIEPGHTYMFGAMVKCSKITTDVSVRVNFPGSDGSMLKREVRSNRIGGDTDWTFLSGIFKAPDGEKTARMILALSEPGTVWFKGAIMMEVTEGWASSLFFDQRLLREPDDLAAWPVNPIVKVFHEDLPPDPIVPANITVAGNETEPLQLALRSKQDCRDIRIDVIPPENSGGRKLDEVTVSVVGYVPIDYPSNYYGTSVPYWYSKYPDQDIGSDGWAGFWPDPLLPKETFDLQANITQPVWIEVTVPTGTEAGDYRGLIRIFKQDSLVKEVPWNVHVWNFNLPRKNAFGATYDIRDIEDISDSGMEPYHNVLSENEFRDTYWSFMAMHRINGGEITPAPVVKLTNGRLSINFDEYDQAASYYFDELKNPFAYMPTGMFYLFGWAFPPEVKYNEKPYSGEYPYENADRGQLRPEYKKAYQLVLKTFWEHVKEKGWADRYVLYLSDEPHMAENSNADIVGQMKALCDMIHEVDPKIPVYVSTWNYRPEWKGYINVWGVAYNGGETGYLVPAEDYEKMKRSGDRIWYTTDGNFCTETPYMALERLLPYFGYKYGAEAYEFWGVNWLTYNPYQYGWHAYIFESQAPGESSWKRYPNGDGYIIYPGEPIGQPGLVASIRLKQVREGAEDYEYLSLLGKLIDRSESKGLPVKQARRALQHALDLVNIPCAMGRYSTRILKNPDEVYTAREEVARNIEELINR
jgi:hypothetical protein